MKNMEDLDRLMRLINSLKKEKPNETDWYRYSLEHSKKDIIFIRIDLGERGECSGWIPKGTYLGALLRYFKVPYLKGARLMTNGVPCNLANRVYSWSDISYK